MPSKKKTSRTAPKVFHCSGHGDCNMVFTRSEHLARHIRKHTGEKPFNCIVPGCSRMFTRFDNMMQHTRTHGRHKKRASSSAGSATAGSAAAPPVAHIATEVASEASAAPNDVPNDASSAASSAAPSAPPSAAPIASTTTNDAVSQITTAAWHPIPSRNARRASMLQSRTLPQPALPPKTQWKQRHSFHAFASTPSAFTILKPIHPQHQQQYQQQQHQQQQQQHQYQQQQHQYQRYPQQQQHYYYPYQEDNTTTTTLSSPWSSASSSHDMDVYMPKRMSLPMYESTSSHFSLPDRASKRRCLSIVDLETPIGHWSEHTPDGESDTSSIIEVSSDEYDAIIGFGRLHHQTPSKPASPTITIDNPDLHLLHPLYPVQESF